MADKKQAEPKMILEREYIIPLRKEWRKVPEYKRANKAVKAVKEFLVRHMKIYDRDLRRIKVDILLNNELRFRGMRKPPARIKIKAKKYDDESVRVELAELPEVLKYKIAKEEKRIESRGKVEKKQEVEKKEEVGEKEKEEREEKKQSVKEAGRKEAKMQAKQMKHTSSTKEVKIQRKALQK